LVEELAKRDVRVLAGMRDPGAFEAVPAGRALEVRPVRIDLSSRDRVGSSLDELGSDLGDVGVLVNNAGLFEGGRLEEQDLDLIYGLVQVNLAAMIHLSHRFLKEMLRRDRGKIVNNASIAGYVHFPGSAAYSASKAGVVAFSESLRREVKDTGVSVMHLVTPGVDTDMMDATEAAYEPYVKDASGWGHNDPAEWAEKVVKGIEDDDDIVGPGGPEALAKLASRGPAAVMDLVAGFAFDREGK
nr:SDR family NAD(P)-dependent oxidoreductase [Thermoleophilaceae bacterium]